MQQINSRIRRFAVENDTSFVKADSHGALGKVNLVKLEDENQNKAFHTQPMGRKKRNIDDEEKVQFGQRRPSFVKTDFHGALGKVHLVKLEDGNQNKAFQKPPMGRRKRSIEDGEKEVQFGQRRPSLQPIQNSYDRMAKVFGEYRLKRSFAADNDSAKFMQWFRNKREIMIEANQLKKDSANFVQLSAMSKDNKFVNDNDKTFVNAKDKQFVKMSKINDVSKIKSMNCDDCHSKDAKIWDDDSKMNQVIAKRDDDKELKVQGIESDRLKREIRYEGAIDGTTEPTDDTKPVDRQKRHYIAADEAISGETTTEFLGSSDRTKRALNLKHENGI